MDPMALWDMDLLTIYLVMCSMKFVIVCGCSYTSNNTPQQADKPKPRSATQNCHRREPKKTPPGMALLLPRTAWSVSVLGVHPYPLVIYLNPSLFSFQVTSRPIHSPDERKLKVSKITCRPC